MGRIYSGAEKMFAWLGTSPGIIHLFDALSTLREKHGVSPSKAAFGIGREGGIWTIEAARAWEDLLLNAYWYRAWISQELALYKRLIFLAGHIVLDAKMLTGFDETVCVRHVPGLPAKYCNFWIYMGIVQGTQRLKGENIVDILRDLPFRECLLSRDQVYSILSLAIDGPLIVVDYQSSELHVINQFVHAWEKSL
jgi:hypothetical protein